MILCLLIAVTPIVEVSSTTEPTFTLKCNTNGAPAVVSWSYSNGLRMYANDDTHRLSRMLLNGTTSNFESSLVFISDSYQSDTSEHLCIATVTYVSANNSETNMSTAVGK